MYDVDTRETVAVVTSSLPFPLLTELESLVRFGISQSFS